MALRSIVLLTIVVLAAASSDVLNRGDHLRGLLARAKTTSKAVAEKGATAKAVGSAIAKGDVTALVESIAEANNKGDALAAAQAIADATREDPELRNAAAAALAKATDLSEDAANLALERGDVQNIARAIGNSTGGVTTVEAISVSRAVSESQPAIASAISMAFSAVNAGGEALAEAKVSATAIGKAIAVAYTRAEVTIRVIGSGAAVGQASADAEALAESFAQVIAEGLAKAANDFSKSEATFKVDAISTVIATAATNSYAEAAQDGEGETIAIQENLAESVAEAVTEVVAEAIALAFGGEAETFTFVEAQTSTRDVSKAETESQVVTAPGGEGVTEGASDAFSAEKCTSMTLAWCCGLKATASECSHRCRGKKCSFTRVREEGGRTTFWENVDTGKICQCVPLGGL
ncbi:hypothetical protein BSKO_03358 [Bryopsis sp. KO-2023]|nr:hypothetical protein BSKO_03358 [Bryopsis sp. KO-2023]